MVNSCLHIIQSQMIQNRLHLGIKTGRTSLESVGMYVTESHLTNCNEEALSRCKLRLLGKIGHDESVRQSDLTSIRFYNTC